MSLAGAFSACSIIRISRDVWGCEPTRIRAFAKPLFRAAKNTPVKVRSIPFQARYLVNSSRRDSSACQAQLLCIRCMFSSRVLITSFQAWKAASGVS